MITFTLFKFLSIIDQGFFSVAENKQIESITIENELKQSYLDYAMSVIVGRALPDARDGLKPVHRRVLFAMSELKNDWNKPYKKSARVVGDVIGKYHPHSDTAAYDTIVRMAQSFSLRYMLVDGQGNFGSVDGDSPAAMRYTEIRMTKIAHSVLADLDKDTVNFSPNYDGSEQVPDVLPTRVPNLLVNGSSGIAVGMATNVPPHNLGEVVQACLALIENPNLSCQELMTYIPGPDFPTAAIINGRAGIAQAYLTGRGRIYLRAKHSIEEDSRGKSSIIIHELPFQVNKARLLEKIGVLVREKRIEGITALRDESDKQGMRMVIEVRRGDQPEVVLNNLFAQTQLQTVFGMNLLALDHGQPRTFTLKGLLEVFIAHRREVVTRRSYFELRKLRARAHILEGLAVALSSIDPIIALIKASSTPAEAREALLAKAWPPGDVSDLLVASGAQATRPEDLDPGYGLLQDAYHLSPKQAQAILDLKLHRLTGLEKDKIHQEYAKIIEEIAYLLKLISDFSELNRVVAQELKEVADQFSDPRRTEIREVQDELTHEDLIESEDVVVTLSRQGYIKNQPLSTYQSQHRGGRGKKATEVKSEDVVSELLIANSHDQILCFSTSGKVYWLKVYKIPQASRQSRGRPLINLLPLDKDESITKILPVNTFDDEHFIVMVTHLGKIKKVPLSLFARPRSSGLIALGLNDGDSLVDAILTDGKQEILLLSNAGKALRFNEGDVRPMGRSAAGVRGMSLESGQHIISAILVKPHATILAATENGYGQRTVVEDYRVTSRGLKGVIAIQTDTRNGALVGACQVEDDDDLLLISDRGTMVRLPVGEVSVVGRNTKGVRLIQLGDDEHLVGIEAIVTEGEVG